MKPLNDIIKDMLTYISENIVEGKNFDSGSESGVGRVLLQLVLHVDDVGDVGKLIQDGPDKMKQ